MAQASVLTDTEIRRVFRIIDTTRHAGRNRVAFELPILAGLRVGEIAAAGLIMKTMNTFANALRPALDEIVYRYVQARSLSEFAQP